MARSCSGGVGIRYALPVLSMTSDVLALFLVHSRNADVCECASVSSEPTKKRSLSLSDETKSKLLSTESRDRSARHDDVTSGEEEYDAEAYKHLQVDCSVCLRVSFRQFEWLEVTPSS